MTKESPKSTEPKDADAISVDWIVLTAAFLGLSVVTAASIQAGSEGLAANVSSYVISSAF